MDAKRLAIGTVVGGIAMFGATYLIWNIAFDYYVVAIEAAGVAREPQLLWVAALSNVPFAALVTLVIERGDSSTIGGGVKIGAMVGILNWGGCGSFSLCGYDHLRSHGDHPRPAACRCRIRQPVI